MCPRSRSRSAAWNAGGSVTVKGRRTTQHRQAGWTRRAMPTTWRWTRTCLRGASHWRHSADRHALHHLVQVARCVCSDRPLLAIVQIDSEAKVMLCLAEGQVEAGYARARGYAGLRLLQYLRRPRSSSRGPIVVAVDGRAVLVTFRRMRVRVGVGVTAIVAILRFRHSSACVRAHQSFFLDMLTNDQPEPVTTLVEPRKL